ncbi:feline leukemia virus subgroup C receptor-related protein 2 [Trichonephila clavipes]|nr:feline leukemia virus subgroup C receptor-related protein 2 [Trichonephila clavipes]
MRNGKNGIISKIISPIQSVIMAILDLTNNEECDLQGVKNRSQQKEIYQIIRFFFDNDENASQEARNGVYGPNTVTTNYVQFWLNQFRPDIYCQQLDHLMLAIDLKRPELVNRRGVVLHQDNSRSNTSIVTRQKHQELGLEVLMHPPYSAHLVETSLAICVCSLLTFLIFSGCLYVNHLWVQFITISLFGFFLTSFLPIGFEYGIEVTYPQSEAICACLLNASAMLFGIILTEMLSHILESEGPLSSNAALTVTIFMCCIIANFITRDYKRYKKNAEIKSLSSQ